MKRIKKLKGFTLVELIVVVALLVIVITVSTSMITLANRTHTITLNEYEMQSTVRQASVRVNDIVRYSKAVFAVPVEFVADVSVMDPGWNYFSVSPDGRRVANYIYDSVAGTHVENIVVEESDNIEYEIVYEKDLSTGNDKMMRFSIVAHLLQENADGDMERTARKIVFESQIEALNAIQVVDKGTMASPAVALAYRNDSQVQDTGRTQVAKVAIVMDVSGSMDYSLDGDTRIGHLKKALKGYTKPDGTVVQGILNMFAAENNIEITLVPFSETANYPRPDQFSATEHPIYNAQDDIEALRDIVDDMITYGSTNTGDGLRRAHYRLADFSPTANGYASDVEQYDYMIVLVDGETNDSSWNATADRVWINTWWGGYWSNTFSAINHFTSRGGVNLSLIRDGVTRPYSYGSNNDGYITTIGDLIEAREVTCYVIGFATGLTTQITHIGNALSAEEVYMYSDDFDLDEVFANIAQDIMAELWLVSGPQIQ